MQAIRTRDVFTVTRYEKRAIALAKKARRALGIASQSELDPRAFAIWLADIRHTFAKATWRQYKASLIEHLRHQPSSAAQEAIEFLINTESASVHASAGRTSATKLKRFPPADFEAVLQVLRQRSNPLDPVLGVWLRAGLITGLRPQEWLQSEIITIDDLPALRVVNAKHSNGRANGPTRTLMLDRLSEEERQLLAAQVSYMQALERSGEFDPLYHRCRVRLQRVVRRLWPRRRRYPTLYSTRHQFAANAKASGASKAEVAALMGHAVDDTATTHYGKTRNGTPCLKVWPLPAEVASVRAVRAGAGASATLAPDGGQ